MIALPKWIPRWMGGPATPPLAPTAKPFDPPAFGQRSPNRRETIEAAYDAAGYGSLTERSWLNADNLTADEANNPGVRQVARSRSRYECLEANSFLKGAIHTVAQDLVGRGPRLQLNLPDAEANAAIELLWSRWSKATRYAKHLRTTVVSRIVDGEGFGLHTTSGTIPADLPQLFYRPFESDRCMSPYGTPYTGPLQVDGLRIDDAGEVVNYFIYDEISPLKLGIPREISREQVCHLFRQDRPGQHRGIPELLTSLPLCVLLRDYTLACVTAARTAAKHAVLLETQASAVNSGETPVSDLVPFQGEEIDYDMMSAIPRGWHASQMKAEQPTTTYEMFRDSLLGEIVRPLGAPLNIVLGSSAKWNYASTQADHISYALKQLIEREELETEIVDRSFALWWQEAQLMGILPEVYAGLNAEEVSHAWFWDSRKDADPQTMATARATNLKNGVTNRADELFTQGKDYESHDATAAKTLGLTVEQYRQLVARSIYGSSEIDSVLQSTSTSTSTSVPMNGAQLQSLSLVVSQVSQGLMQPLAARALVAVAFPGLKPEQIAPMFPVIALSPQPSAVSQSPTHDAAPTRRSGSGVPATEALAQ